MNGDSAVVKAFKAMVGALPGETRQAASASTKAATIPALVCSGTRHPLKPIKAINPTNPTGPVPGRRRDGSEVTPATTPWIASTKPTHLTHLTQMLWVGQEG